jgi:hypothetical protein
VNYHLLSRFYDLRCVRFAGQAESGMSVASIDVNLDAKVINSEVNQLF